MAYELVIRNGTIVDGLGGEPFVGDVAVSGGVIAAVGKIDERGIWEIDAAGLLVTPGFIDLHTHYDGQAIWSDRMTPSSAHGVTTAVMGNCGVGFAPCRTEDHEVLVDVMAGVEDIPGVVMVDGLPWDWETFPEYLDALDSRRRDIDVAAYLPHSPLRVYVMGQRGADREPATAEDLDRMRALAKQAIEVGALGFASSRFSFHKTASGELIPTYDAAQAEISAIADGVADGGGGLIQFVPDIAGGGYADVLQQVFEAAQDAGLPVTFTLATGNTGDPIWPEAITMIEKFNAVANEDNAITAQVFPRPIGLVIGLELTGNPFVFYPSYREIADLPLAERVAEMCKPEVRARILADKPDRRRPSAAVSGAGVELDLPADRRPELRARPVDVDRRARGRPRREPHGGGLRPAARRRRPRHASGGNGQLREQLARHGRPTDPPRRRGTRPRRRRGPLRNDLRRKLSDIPAGALDP